MELDVWEGNFGLPSLNPQCLIVMSYCQFSKAPVKFCWKHNAFWTPTGELPVLKHGASTLANIKDILAYLRQNSFGNEHHLSTKQSGVSVAYQAMVETKLAPAVEYLIWGNSRNYTEFTRRIYGNLVGFPLSLFYPLKKWREADDIASGVTSYEDLVARNAIGCLSVLSKKLGRQPYFFGTSPSALDATVFGYLLPILRLPLPSSPLKAHVENYQNLYDFCERILNSYFPSTTQEKKDVKKKTEDEQNRQKESFPHQTQNYLTFACVALGAMGAYAFGAGILNLEFVNSLRSSSVEDDDEG